MKYTVDASVALKWFVKEPLHDEAILLLEDSGQLTAPDLIVSEVMNIAWKKAIRGEIDHDQAYKIVAGIDQIFGSFYPSTTLADSALRIALTLNHPVYDCMYLACAEATGTVLVTADKQLGKTVANTPWQKLVIYVGDVDI